MEKEVKQQSTNLSKPNTSSSQTFPPAEIQEVMGKLSEEKPEVATKISEFIAMASSSGNPLHNKINEEHVTKIIDLTSKHDEREFELCKRNQDNEMQSQWQLLAAFILVLVLIVIILSLFKNQPVVLVPILTGVGGLISGFIGGFGYGKSRK